MGLMLSLIAISSGFCLSGIVFCILNLTLFHMHTFFAAVIMAFSSLVAYCIVYSKQKKRYKSCMQLWSEKGDEMFEAFAKSELRHSIDTVYKSKLAINLCNIYTENGDITAAFDILQIANPHNNNRQFNNWISLSDKYKMLYYNNVIYLNLLNNDIVSANANYSDGKRYIDEFIECKEFSIGLLHTVAMLELASGQANDAMNTLKKALSMSQNETTTRELLKLKGKILAEMI